MKIYDTYRKSIEESPIKPIIEIVYDPKTEAKQESKRLLDWMYCNISVGLYNAIVTEMIERELNSNHKTFKVKLEKI